MLRRRSVAVAGLLVVALLAGSAAAPAVQAQPKPSDEVEVTRLVLADGTPLGGALEVNDRGQVIAAPSTSLGYLWEDGQATLLNPAPQQWMNPVDISNQGLVVGVRRFPLMGFTIPMGAFLWKGGQFAPMNIWWDDYYGSYFATSVNDRGQVAMWFADRGGVRRLAVLDAAGQTTLSPDGISFMEGPEGSWERSNRWEWASVINDRGQVAFNIGVDGESHAAIWDVAAGEIADLGTLGGESSTFQDINGLGMVAGTSTTADGEEHAFFWHNGEMTDLGTLGGDSSAATDINEWGQVIGTSTTADGEERGFVWYQGQMTEIGPLGGDTGAAITPAAINNWGQVVGTSTTDEGPEHAFLWQNDRIVNLGQVAGAGRSAAVDVNDGGEVLGGVGVDAREGVLWTVSPLWGYADDPASDLAAARQQWDESRPDAYRVTVAQSCFCPPEVVEPRAVTVEGDEVTDVDPPIPGGLGVEPLTVDVLFDVLERAVVEADALDVTYNEAYGIPQSIDIDWIAGAADDEIWYEVQSFEPLD